MTPWLLPLLPAAGAAAVLAVARLAPARGAGATIEDAGENAGDSARDARRPVAGHVVLLTAVALAAVLATLGVALWAAARLAAADWTLWGPRLDPGLAVRGLGRSMVVLVPVVAAPVLLYTAAYLRTDPALPRFLALLLAFTGAMELLVAADDLLTLLVGWELVGACSYALIGHDWRDATRPRAGLAAFLTTRTGDLGLYLATAAALSATGSLRFEALAGLRGPALHVAAAGLLFAAAAKSAQLPFAPWLFSAMAGPTPASALLHSATLVAAGAYALARLVPLLPAAAWLGPAVAGLGLATALAGGLVATLQSDLKRALAASTSAQYGLMLVAIGAGFPGAAGVHLVTHAAYKALLFLGAGVAIHAAGTGDLGVMHALRLGGRRPRAALLFGVGALALAAVPPLGGAYSKEQILAASAHGGRALALGVLLASVLSALYAGRLHVLAFGWGRGSPHAAAGHAATSTAELAAMALLAVLSLALGVLWVPGAGEAAGRLAGAPLAEDVWWGLPASLAAIALAGAAGWALAHRGALVTLGVPAPVRDVVAGWFGIPRLTAALVVTPGLALARWLAAFDDRAVDAGIRGVARLAGFASRAFGWWGERGIDGVVAGVVGGTLRAARLSRRADDRGVDAAAEGVARQVGVVGAQSRRLQTGLAHHYYVIAAVGVLVLVLAAALGRSRP